MDPVYSIRPFQSEDEEKIVSLLTLTFKGWPHFDLPCSPLDHWKWKFMSGVNTIIVAESDGRIIGCDHGLFTNIKIGNNVVKCRQGVDAAVHTDFRYMGVYSKLDKLKTEKGYEANIGIVYYATNNPIVVKVDQKSGSKPFPQPIPILIRVNDVDLFVKDTAIKDNQKKHFLRYLVHTAKMYNKFERLAVRPVKENSRISVTNLDQFDERVDFLWNVVKEDYFFIKERTSGYLNWRYRDPRGGVYTVKQAVQDDEVLGYIVLRIKSYEGRREGFIVDILTLQDRYDCFEALIGEGLRFFDEAGVNAVYYCGVLRHPYVKFLRRFGFLNSRRYVNVYYGIRAAGEDFSQFEAASPGRLLFHYGDIDWI